MKPALKLPLLLAFALCVFPALSDHGQAPDPAKPAEINADPVVSVYKLNNQRIQIAFKSPIILEEKKGSAMKEGFLSISPEVKFQSKWVRADLLELELLESLQLNGSYTVAINKGETDINGDALPEKAGTFEGPSRVEIRKPYKYPYEGTGLPDLILYENNYLPLDENILGKVEFQEVDGSELIAGEAAFMTKEQCLGIKELSWDLEYYLSRLPGIRDMQAGDSIQSMIFVRPEKALSPGKKWRIVVYQPKAKEDSPKLFSGDLRAIEKFRVSAGFDPSDQSRESVKPKERTMYLHINMPVRDASLEEIFRNHLSVTVDKNEAIQVEGENRKAAESPKGGITFELDSKWLEKNRERKKSGFSIPIIIRGDGVFESRVKVKGLTAYDGQKGRNDVFENTIEVKEGTPLIELDAGSNGVMSMGNRIIGISLWNMEKVKVAAKKISSDYTANALSAYQGYYQGERQELGTASSATKMHFIPFDMLKGEGNTAEKTFPVSGETYLKASLDDLFSQKVEPGMYFLEVKAEVSPGVLEGYRRFGLKVNNEILHLGEGDKGEFGAQAIVQVTDLGLLWKRSGKNLFTYVFSLTTGQPVPSGKITLIDKDGQSIVSGTVKGGISLVDIPKETKYLKVSSGNDSYITKINDSGSEIEMWNFDVNSPPYYWEYLGDKVDELGQKEVFFFSDRGIYRPGETVNLKGISRILKGNELIVPKAEPAFITLKSPEGNTLMSRRVELSEYGTFDLSFNVPEEEVGTYKVNLYYPRDGKSEEESLDVPLEGDRDRWEYYYEQQMDRKNRSFSFNIKVQEFKRNEFEVKSEFAAESRTGDKEVEVKAKAANYTGIPLAGSKINWYLIARAGNFYPRDYRDYSFGDYRGDDRGYWYHYYGYGYGDDGYSGYSGSTVKSQGELNEAGEARVKMTIPQSQFPRQQKITISSEVTNANEQTIKDTLSRIIHPASVYVGIRRGSYVKSAGKEMDILLLAVDQDGKPYTAPLEVDVKVTRRAFEAVRYGDWRSTTVRNEAEERVVHESKTTINPKDNKRANNPGTIVKIGTGEPGVYLIEVSGKDAEGRDFRSADRKWVYGGNYSPWEYQDGLRMTLIPDKNLYSPGETAKVLLQTPIEGEVIVTVEREKVLRSYKKTVTLKDSIVEVPIEFADVPNVYVSVFLAKGAMDSKRELKEPQLKLGYCSLRVRPDKYKLNVSLNTPRESVLPGSKMEITGKITDYKGKPVGNAEVVLYVEDEGTLDVVGYKTPNPLADFYSDRYLRVRTFKMLEQLLSENLKQRSFDNKGVFIGGGDGYEGDEDLLSRIRKEFNPCAYWIADLKTNANGTFRAQYTNPDTLTRYRVMAVVVDKGQSFGSGESKYVVNKPVMIEPGLPVFASLGDSLTIPVTVSKTTEREGKWILELKTNDKAVAKTASKTVDIPRTGMTTVPFEVEFTDLGTAALSWSLKPVDDQGNILKDASNARLADNLENSFEVILPAPMLREKHFFTLEPGKTLNLEKMLSPELQSARLDFKIKMGNSPLIYAESSISFLLGYPYGCLEQTSSQTIPWIYADVLSSVFPSFPEFTPERRKEVLQAAADKILRHQRGDGGLSYWIGDTSTDSYSMKFAPYGALTLLLTREKGALVPDSSLKSLYHYLDQVSEENSGLIQEYFSAWVLAKAGVLTEAKLNRLLDKEAKFDDDASMSGYRQRACRIYLALALLDSGHPKASETALRLVEKQSGKNEGKGYNYSEGMSVNDNAMELLIRSKAAPAAQETREYFVQFLKEKTSRARIYGYRSYDTWTDGWETMALAEYLSHAQIGGEDLLIAVRETGSEKEIALPGTGKSVHLDLKKTPEASLTLQNEGQIAYGEMDAEGRPVNLDFAGVHDKGFKIERVYEKLDIDGNWVLAGNFTVGDVVRVTMTAESSRNSANYVVIEDYMPSTFEAINPALSSQNGNIRIKSSDYHINTWISNCEFRKDRVRFFANSWHGAEKFRASYLVRVTKAGTATAPPAKAELMYEPQTYGLSSSVKFTVSPRSTEK